MPFLASLVEGAEENSLLEGPGAVYEDRGSFEDSGHFEDARRPQKKKELGDLAKESRCYIVT